MSATATATLLMALATVPADFTESNILTKSAMHGDTVVICTTNQYNLAKSYANACKLGSSNVDNSYCSVIATNRYCEPTTRDTAVDFGILATRFYSNSRFHNTYRFIDKDAGKGADYSQNPENYMCTPDQKQVLTASYSECTKSSSECMNDANNLKLLMCEAPRAKNISSQQIITEVTSKTIEEK